MPYCDQNDLTGQLTEAVLIQLTDDSGAGTVDAANLNAAISDASAEIDAYAASRYRTPFGETPVPPMIRKIAVDIAIYHLFSRSVLAMPEERRKRYENAVRFLRDLAKGVIALGASEAGTGAESPALPACGLPVATRTQKDRIFTMGKAGCAGSLDAY